MTPELFVKLYLYSILQPTNTVFNRTICTAGSLLFAILLLSP